MYWCKVTTMMSGVSPAWITVTKRGRGDVVPDRARQGEVEPLIIGALRVDATGLPTASAMAIWQWLRARQDKPDALLGKDSQKTADQKSAGRLLAAGAYYAQY
jgi:hypothetical protein